MVDDSYHAFEVCKCVNGRHVSNSYIARSPHQLATLTTNVPLARVCRCLGSRVFA